MLIKLINLITARSTHLSTKEGIKLIEDVKNYLKEMDGHAKQEHK